MTRELPCNKLLKMIEGSELPIGDDNSATILDNSKILFI